MKITLAYGFSSLSVYSTIKNNENVDHVGDLFGIKIYVLSWRLALKLGPKNGGNVDSPRTPHSLAAGPEHKGFDVIQHAFAPQGGGRIEDAMRRVTAASRSWRVGSIESRPDLGSRSFSILLQVADSCLFLKQKTYSEFVVRKHAKTAQASPRCCFRDNSWCFVTEEKRYEY